jgi:hypothetical protein
MAGALRFEELRSRAPEYLLTAFVVVAGGIAGALGVRNFRLGALVVAALVVLLLVSRRPVVLGIVAVGAVFFVQRLGSTHAAPGSGGGVSYSDALVTAASIMALPAVAGTPELRRLRSAAYAIAVYLALLVPGVLANPSPRAYLEWTHRLVMLGGALLVGAWLVRERAERTALRLLVLVSVVVGIMAIYNTFTHGLAPAAPSQWNKNFLGAIFSSVLIVVLMAPQAIRLPPLVRIGAIVAIGGGLLASQSRGGELAAVFGLLVALVLNPRLHSVRTRAVEIVVGLAVAAAAVISIRHQLNLSRAALDNSSVGVRINVERVTRRIWRSSPFVGVGLKYFFSGHFGPYAYPANNVIDNELAESGLIGLAGFVLFQAGVLVAGIRRRTTPMAAAAVGVVAAQLLHGMVDIYWSAGVVTLPFLLLGIGLAGRAPAPAAAGPAAGLPAGVRSAD